MAKTKTLGLGCGVLFSAENQIGAFGPRPPHGLEPARGGCGCFCSLGHHGPRPPLPGPPRRAFPADRSRSPDPWGYPLTVPAPSMRGQRPGRLPPVAGFAQLIALTHFAARSFQTRELPIRPGLGPVYSSLGRPPPLERGQEERAFSREVVRGAGSGRGFLGCAVRSPGVAGLGTALVVARPAVLRPRRARDVARGDSLLGGDGAGTPRIGKGGDVPTHRSASRTWRVPASSSDASAVPTKIRGSPSARGGARGVLDLTSTLPKAAPGRRGRAPLCRWKWPSRAPCGPAASPRGWASSACSAAGEAEAPVLD